MGALFERLARLEWDHPVRTNVILFGAIIIGDVLIGGISGLSIVMLLIGAFRIFGMRRPDGYLRKMLTEKYGWED